MLLYFVFGYRQIIGDSMVDFSHVAIFSIPLRIIIHHLTQPVINIRSGVTLISLLRVSKARDARQMTACNKC